MTGKAPPSQPRGIRWAILTRLRALLCVSVPLALSCAHDVHNAPQLATPSAPSTMPAPYRARGDAAVALNETCETCHRQEALEWRASRHHLSNTNDAYRTALAVEPSSFCRGCHAPESILDGRDESAQLSGLGVGCVTCHVTDASGTVLSAVSMAPHEAPHPVARSAAFTTTGACGACHEFRFPGVSGDDESHLMQTTMREHARSPGASTACATCHMPAVGLRRRSHTFAEVRDPEWLRANLHAEAEPIGDDAVRVTLRQPAPGHAFPSGDLFRRLEVGAEWRDAEQNLVARDVRHLARHFPLLQGESSRRLVRDDRIEAEPGVVELARPSSSRSIPATLTWWVTYQRVATVGRGAQPANATIESEVRLHSGTIERHAP